MGYTFADARKFDLGGYVNKGKKQVFKIMKLERKFNMKETKLLKAGEIC